MFLDDTVDLIGQASSNPLLIFCICNFIIAILFISGFRSDSTSQDQYSCNFRQLAAAAAAAPTPAHERIEVARPPTTEEENGSNDQQNQSNDDHDNDDHNNNNNNNDCEEDKDGDDELRKRVEEFIEKINRRWQAEKMMQGCLTPLPTAV